jgi:hypothetical protein
MYGVLTFGSMRTASANALLQQILYALFSQLRKQTQNNQLNDLKDEVLVEISVIETV